MKYAFDLDGTLCLQEKDGDYTSSYPWMARVKKVNWLYDQGHTIYIYTARGMGSTDNSPPRAMEKYYALTLEQLTKWGIRHHGLFFGKPSVDRFIDDRATVAHEFFNDFIY